MMQGKTSNGDWYDQTLPAEVILDGLFGEESVRPVPDPEIPSPGQDIAEGPE